MSSLKATKKRITSVRSTQKITKAMQLVAASKFSKALERRHQAIQYGTRLDGMLWRCLSHEGSAEACYPYLSHGYHRDPYAQNHDQDQTSARSLMVVLSSDRGLCGSFNAQVFKKALAVIANGKPHPREMNSCEDLGSRVLMEDVKDYLSSRTSQSSDKPQWDVFLWGKKSWGLESSFAALDSVPQVYLKESFAVDRITSKKLASLRDILVEKFCSGQWQSIFIVRCEFESALVQRAHIENFLPLSLDDIYASASQNAGDNSDSHQIWEPKPLDLAEMLVNQRLEFVLNRAILESQVCEHAARMTAMDSATQNATDVIKNLTLEYNRARQAAITTELVEITSGAEALS